MTYNDKSALENYHISCAFKVARKKGCNFFAHFPDETYSALRIRIIDLVLATDLALHIEHISNFKSRLSSGWVCDMSVSSDRSAAMTIFLKMADISHCLRRLEIHTLWSLRIMDEFFLQGDEEKKRGFDVSTIMDREKYNLASSQLGFLDFIGKPMLTVFLDVSFPGKNAKQQFPRLLSSLFNENYEHWINGGKGLWSTQKKHVELSKVRKAQTVVRLQSHHSELSPLGRLKHKYGTSPPSSPTAEL